MSETATINGKPQRKLLADQLDRLDTIIDALSEGLNGAVADAAREGTRLAVKDAIIEIMTNPELRALLAPVRELASVPAVPAAPTVVPTPAPAMPSLWTRMKAKAAAIWAAVIQAATKAKAAVGDAWTAVAGTCQAARETVASVGEVLPVKRVLWIAAGVGLAVGLVCLVMPQTAAAAVSAVSVAVNAIAVQAGNRLKRVARRFGLIS